MLPDRWLVTALLLVSASVVGGCHTVEGVGKDVEATGLTISEAARDAQDDFYYSE